MKRKLTAAALLAVSVVAVVWLFLPPEAKARIISYKDVAETISALKTFTAGIALSGASGTVDFSYDLLLPDPTVGPTASAGAPVAGTCSSANTYRFYVSWENKTGETLISPASADFTPTSGTTNRVIVTRPSAPSEATSWDSWFSSSADGHAAKKGCAASAETNTAIATTTFNCECRTTNTATPTVSNDTNAVTWLKNAKDALLRPELTVKEVCSVGCEYITLSAALAAITDASDSKRYQIIIRAPFQSTESVSLKNYVSLVGEDRYAVKVAELLLPAGSGVDVHLENITFATSSGMGLQADATSSGVVYINNAICGLEVPVNIDCVVVSGDGAGLRWYVTNTLFRSNYDFVRIGANDKWFGSGNTYLASNNLNEVRIWSYKSLGAQIYEANPLISIVPAAGVAQPMTGVHLDSSQGTATQGTQIVIDGGSIRIASTDAARTAASRCVYIGTAGTNSTASEVRLIGTECVISSASSSDALTGIEVDADADHSNWSVSWTGGRIALSGGSTRNDVDNAETVGGFSLRLIGVDHAGAYTGAGTTTVDSPLTDGRYRKTPLAAAPAACSIGDTYADTSGAFCACTAANTWSNMTATGTCV